MKKTIYSMNVFEAIKNRRSIRKFNQLKQVTDAQIDQLLEAARWSPSAGNLQSYFFYVIRDQKIKDRLAQAANRQEFVSQAPVVFVSCADKKQVSCYGERGRTLYCIQDATLATLTLWLAAVEMGLGAVWVGAMDESQVIKILNLPDHLRPVALLPLGFPAESPRPRRRRNTNRIANIL